MVCMSPSSVSNFFDLFSRNYLFSDHDSRCYPHCVEVWLPNILNFLVQVRVHKAHFYLGNVFSPLLLAHRMPTYHRLGSLGVLTRLIPSKPGLRACLLVADRAGWCIFWLQLFDEDSVSLSIFGFIQLNGDPLVAPRCFHFVPLHLPFLLRLLSYLFLRLTILQVNLISLNLSVNRQTNQSEVGLFLVFDFPELML